MFCVDFHKEIMPELGELGILGATIEGKNAENRKETKGKNRKLKENSEF